MFFLSQLFSFLFEHQASIAGVKLFLSHSQQERKPGNIRPQMLPFHLILDFFNLSLLDFLCNLCSLYLFWGPHQGVLRGSIWLCAWESHLGLPREPLGSGTQTQTSCLQTMLPALWTISSAFWTLRFNEWDFRESFWLFFSGHRKPGFTEATVTWSQNCGSHLRKKTSSKQVLTWRVTYA